MLRFKPRDLPRLVPKLHGVAVDELLSPFLGVIVVFAEQVYAILNMAVRTNVRSIPVHGSLPLLPNGQ